MLVVFPNAFSVTYFQNAGKKKIGPFLSHNQRKQANRIHKSSYNAKEIYQKHIMKKVDM